MSRIWGEVRELEWGNLQASSFPRIMKRSTNKSSTTLTAQYELKFLNPKKRPEEALGSLSSFTTTHFSKGSWPNVVSNVKRIN